MRRLRWALLALLALALLLGLLIWSAGSAGGLGWLGRQVAGAQLEGATGSLWQGLQAERLRVELPGWRIEAEGIAWQPLAVGPRRVDGGLQLRRLRLTPLGPPGAPLTEARLRESLRLPLALRLAPLRVARFEWADQLTLTELGASEASLIDGALTFATVNAQWPRADGRVQLQGDAQLAQQLRLTLHAALPERQLQARLQAQGPLAALPVKLDIRHGETGRLEAQGELAPLQAQPLRKLQGRLLALDPQALHPALPAGRWDGELALQPDGSLLQLQASAANARALRLDEGGWPLRRLRLEAALDPADWTRSRVGLLEAELGNARAGAGRLLLAPQALPRGGAALQAQLRVDNVRLSGLQKNWPALQLQGELDAQQAQLGQGALQLRTALRALPLPGVPALLGSGWRLNAEARWQAGVLDLNELLVRELADTPARLQATGRLRFAGSTELALQAESRAWRLLLPPWQAPSTVEARAQLQLAQAQGLWTGTARLQLLDGTRLADQALQGEAQWQGERGGARWQATLLEGSGADLNRVEAEGRQPPRQLAAWQPERLRWQLPRLARLQALAAPWVAPLAGSSSGEWAAGAGALSLQNLRAGSLQLDSLQAALRADRTLSLQLVKLVAPGLLLNEAQLEGSLAEGGSVSLRALADVAALREQRNPPRSLLLQARSGAPQAQGDAWLLPDLSLQLGEAGGPSWLQLEQARVALQPALKAVQLQAGSLRVAGEPLQLQEARAAWPLQGVLRLQGQPRLAPWLQVAQPEAGWGGDLRAGFSLALQQAAGARPQVRVSLQRDSGDLLLGKEALGLQQLVLVLQQGAARETALRAELAGSRLGEARLQLDTGPGGQALRGRLALNLPALEALQPWLRSAAPGLLLAGSAQAELGLSGSLAEPRAAGTASAQLTRALHAPSGVGLGAARLRLQLREEGLRIEELRGEGLGKDGGSLSGEGELRWAGLRADQLDRLQGSLQLKLERLRLLQRFDRRLVASGQLRAELLPKLLRLRGALAADEGVFEIGRSDAPTLDDDVRVLRPTQPGALPPRRTEAALPRLQRDVDLRVNLGERLRIAGRGLSSRLTGELRFVEQGGRPLQTTGLIELNGGRYRAYGQNLDIETGLLRFTGPLDNPRLDILAIRPNLETRVGVQVTGTAETPRVRLYSEPEMADSDKLAWLLLGRAPDELGRADTAILQRAALALLAGEGTNPAAELMDKLGLTELSLSQSDDAGTTLRLGAQLSKRWSLGYERSLDAASGSWQLVYRLGQRFRLRAQSGEQSALDLLWLWRYD